MNIIQKYEKFTNKIVEEIISMYSKGEFILLSDYLKKLNPNLLEEIKRKLISVRTDYADILNTTGLVFRDENLTKEMILEERYHRLFYDDRKVLTALLENKRFLEFILNDSEFFSKCNKHFFAYPEYLIFLISNQLLLSLLQDNNIFNIFDSSRRKNDLIVVLVKLRRIYENIEYYKHEVDISYIKDVFKNIWNNCNLEEKMEIINILFFMTMNDKGINSSIIDCF